MTTLRRPPRPVCPDEGILALDHQLLCQAVERNGRADTGQAATAFSDIRRRQYCEAQRAKSIADFVSKTEGALQEVDEAGYWLEPIQDSGLETNGTITELRLEARELLAIFVAITRKAKANKLRN